MSTLCYGKCWHTASVLEMLRRSPDGAMVDFVSHRLAFPLFPPASQRF